MASQTLPATTSASRTPWLPRAPWTLATAIAAPLSLAYLLIEPPAGDLAAATYRSELFARVGFALRDHGWYAAHGHYLPGYSLLAPALGAALGVYAVLALSAVAACALFSLLAERVFPPGAARVAAASFAVGFCVGLLSGRMPYDLGLAIGLGALLALIAGRTRLALGLALLTSAASPVAGSFLALAGAAVALGAVDWGREGEKEGAGWVRAWRTPVNGRRVGDARSVAGLAPMLPGLALMLAALLPIGALALAFPEGGWEPFAASSYWPAVAGVLLIAVALPQGPLTARGRLTVRVGAALYALAMTGAYVLRTPVGGNAARLGALLAAPLLAGVLWDRRKNEESEGPGSPTCGRLRHPRMVLLALAPILLYWQLETPINDVSEVAGEASVRASYYAPLRGELRRLTGGGMTIVEVPLMGSHWEAADLAGHGGIELARGWERQLDTRYGALFYDGTLSARTYVRWLAENRVRYVALPDARLDFAGEAEGRLVAAGLPYLREVWRGGHWRLYAVRLPA